METFREEQERRRKESRSSWIVIVLFWLVWLAAVGMLDYRIFH